jgi:hypothetical protein
MVPNPRDIVRMEFVPLAVQMVRHQTVIPDDLPEPLRVDAQDAALPTAAEGPGAAGPCCLRDSALDRRNRLSNSYLRLTNSERLEC